MSVPEFSDYVRDGRHAFDAERAHHFAHMMRRTAPRRNYQPKTGAACFTKPAPKPLIEKAPIQRPSETHLSFAQRVAARRRQCAEGAANAAD